MATELDEAYGAARLAASRLGTPLLERQLAGLREHTTGGEGRAAVIRATLDELTERRAKTNAVEASLRHLAGP